MEDFHDLLGFDKVYDESFEKIWPIFKKLGVKTCHQIACESGYYTNLMNNAGIYTEGSDVFSGIVGLAKSRYPDQKFYVEDMRNYKLDSKQDLIICVDGCLNHVFSLKEIEEVINSTYENLNNKGYFYIEFWTLDEVSEQNIVQDKRYKLKGYDIHQTERRLGNNIHNMCTKISKDGRTVDVLNAYHTSFDEEKVLEIIKSSKFKKYKKLGISDRFCTKLLLFKY